ncbi:hypothetical protein BDA99DRAFT_538766 [Phascolomyces articulosus]|uniref:Uncharacterized protein n=1 Tax=Phascolomyces articulosus TaxID=60185 RepID=A0AAD5K6X1_9FUNG|nr:hypothetical protein BDA99DRAFT_538766 [Phascolomyces articulosus]
MTSWTNNNNHHRHLIPVSSSSAVVVPLKVLNLLYNSEFIDCNVLTRIYRLQHITLIPDIIIYNNNEIITHNEYTQTLSSIHTRYTSKSVEEILYVAYVEGSTNLTEIFQKSSHLSYASSESIPSSDRYLLFESGSTPIDLPPTFGSMDHKKD